MSEAPTKYKPLGRKAYGSIGHLPASRLGPGDHKVTEGQARICTTKARDKKDMIIVQEKLDGSCVSVARVNGEIIPLGRSGYLANTSPFPQHHLFWDWAWKHRERFLDVLRDGERLCGEWLAQAHGTRYDLGGREPLVAFDIMQESTRLTYADFMMRVGNVFNVPALLFFNSPCSVAEAMRLLGDFGHYGAIDKAEGVMYRVERDGKVDFLAKYVRPDKADGIYLPEVSGKEAVWNWQPCTA